MIAHCADGVCEGIAIGGDRYPGSRFLDHLLRCAAAAAGVHRTLNIDARSYEANPDVKLMVLLGEVGGIDECVTRRTGVPP